MSGSREMFSALVRISGVLISIIPTYKNALVQIQIFFLLIKNFFPKFANFFKTKRE